ncbi:MAG TPA: ATP-binding protein, partial [Pyrinomonadaceae bacterium]|nr:ATP-binding protein [Pyrinomonadaceae bacterium]
MSSERDNNEPSPDTSPTPAQEAAGEPAPPEREPRAGTIEYEKLLDRLASVAQAFGTARELKTIFRALRAFAVASTPSMGIFISLYDQERNERTAVYASSEGEEVDLSTLPPMPMTDSPHSRAVLTNQIIITDDLEQAVVNQSHVYVAAEVDPRRPLSSLVTPMTFMGRTLGAVEVQSPHPAAFTQADATAMRMAANLAAVAIENVRLLERELDRAEREAESEKMRSLGQLAAGVAHDFNNALAAILGRTQLLLRSVKDEKQRRNLEVIETASLDAAETVRRIQTFARRAPGEQLDTVSVARLITDAMQLTRTRWEDDARAHGLHYDINFTRDFEGSDEISASPSEVREVLVNLIFNALDAMPAGGRIDMRETKRDAYVVVEVSDTGHGVPEGLRDRIFEPFFTTKGPQGSGLGLAVSYGIIHRHEGTIEVVSEAGSGSTFNIKLPVAKGASKASIAETEQPPVETPSLS